VFAVSERVKVLALLSGGLDSTLAVKIVQDLGMDVEAVHFTTPFCQCDKCAVNAVGEELRIKIHHLFSGEDFLDLLMDPLHGYGSQMNICIDCRILMLRKAKELAEKIGAEYFVTGEVLNERPFSQRLPAMRLIEKEAGLEGRILRPLSAKLLPETELEKKGLIDRGALHSISGRRRTPQMSLAEELGLRDYPCPSGGCLLTDPQFARRLRDHLFHEGRPTLEQIALLRLGRHFRMGAAKIVVGRNEEENPALLAIAERRAMPHMSAVEYVGPVTLVLGGRDDEIVEKAAAITARYSDAPRGAPVEVRYTNEVGATTTLLAIPIEDEELEKWRI